jgi:hypothetical protein
MKKLLVLIVGLLLTACGWPQLADVPFPNKDNLKIWVVNDLHYLSPKLYNADSPRFKRLMDTTAGKDIVYGDERMADLLKQAKAADIDALIVGGDLTLNGELQSVKDLSKDFDKFKQAGIAVYIEPGNHDIYDGWAAEYFGDVAEPVDQVSPGAWWDAFPVEGAERDPASLSYFSKISDSFAVLMIDSNIYGNAPAAISPPPTNGKVRDKTLTWMADILDHARTEGVTVLPVIHHNLLSHNALLNAGYVLDNADAVRDLFAKYDVTLDLTAHTHMQSISSEGGLTEITTESFAINDSTIGQIEVSPEAMAYTVLKLKQPATQRKAVEKIFYADGLAMGKRSLGHDATDASKALIAKINVDYFNGDIQPGEFDDDPALTYIRGLKNRDFLQHYLDSILATSDQSNVSVTVKKSFQK